MTPRPALVVLAAGPDRRLNDGGHKLAQALGATTVLGLTLRHALASGLPVVAVTAASLAPQVGQQVAARDVIELGEDELARGIGFAIAAGVGARSDAPGWLVLPGDMPLVQPASMLAVAAMLELHPVAYAQHRGRRGQPVGFAGELYSELMSLSGHDGARRLLARYPAFGVEVEDPGVLMGIDSDADLLAVRAALAAMAGASASVGGGAAG